MSDTVPVTLPAMGESVTEGTVVEWHKHPGDAVTEGEVIADVTTDKVDVEVSAPASGVLSRIVVDAGATAAVGAVLAEIVAGAQAGNGASGDVSPPQAEAPPAPQLAAKGDGAGAPAGTATVEITLPAMGESVTEGTIARWVKQPGAAVTEGETLVEVTTDKVDVEVPAPASGTLSEVRAAEGATVAVGAVLGVISAGAGAPAAPAPSVAAPPLAAPAPANATTAASPPTAAPAIEPGDPRGRGSSPLARRAAAIAGVDISAVPGTGPGGLVRAADVRAAQPSGGAAAAPASPSASAPTAPVSAPDGSTPLRGPAAALAAAMEQSREIPTATSFRTIEVGTLEARRAELNAAFKSAGRSDKVSFTHLIGFAIIRAALDVPSMTAHFERTADGAPHRVQPGIHLGLAVDTTRKDGSRFLVVPVIRDAEERDFASFRAEYERLVSLSRTNSLTADDLRGASLTLTNPGGIGTIASVPRLMAGQGTIVATGTIDLPPGLRGSDPARLAELGVAKVLTMTSTYDHRVIQGAESGEFLRRVEQLLGGADGFYDSVFASMGVAAPAATPVTPAAPSTRGDRGSGGVVVTGPADHELLAAVGAGVSLVKGYRSFGHLAAHLDPLGSEPLGDQTMEESHLGLTEELKRKVPADLMRTYVAGDTLADIVPRLRDTYCGTIAYEIEHISAHDQRLWLREKIESGWHRKPLSRERRITLLTRLTKVDAMERYLRRAFVGQKTFSIEGVDAMVPMLEELVNLVAEDGINQVVMGMAHRGRLATITHVANRTYESILVAFEKGEQKRLLGEAPDDPTGDVKYHLGAVGTYLSDMGKPVSIRLLNNPSHLEVVDPVVEGWTRAEQSKRSSSRLVIDAKSALAVLIHGDSAFPGQGVVSETLNLSGLEGYTVGGTVHVISNNQIGFTTDPQESRSTRYASDLAKGFDIPIIHVNADDVEACVQAMRLAYAYRRTFKRDVLVDLIGYRRFGHNETDEPAYTQPMLYAKIKSHPTAREIYAARLVSEGLISAAEADALAEESYTRVQTAHQKVKQTLAGTEEEPGERHHGTDGSDLEIPTGVGIDVLQGLNSQLISVPDGFSLNPKLDRQLRKRAESTAAGEVDWSEAEALALGSLLLQGHPVRLTGQDTERGTFSQRHLVFHDVKNGDRYCPMQNLVGANATFELHNSPLSEAAAVGFEYGYSVAAPDTLVLWEAQFGDFVNGAQVVVDQFMSSGEAKWGTRSRLALLLPHGYEGQGPEHSSARLERFLQLSANGNIRVAVPSTAAQYFHLLRLQAQSPHPRPLVVMTPKSLLRSAAAASSMQELVTGRFRPVVDDPTITPERRLETRTLLLCTGKIYHDLAQSPLREKARKTAIVRVEMLDPIPLEEIKATILSYPNLYQIFWVQEEPRNMGAWGHISRPVGRTRPYTLRWDYIGRPRRASPSEGFHGAHSAEQERIVREALTIETTTPEEARELARSGGRA